jgi:hypothetical protein
MNIDKNANPTVKTVFEVLSERQRSRKRTDLNNLFRQVLRGNPNADHNAFMELFKGMDSNGMGKLVKGRGRNPDRFIWGYDLRQSAEKMRIGGVNPATKKQLDLVTEAKIETKTTKRPGRPVKRNIGSLKAKPRPTAKIDYIAQPEASPVVIQLQLPNTMSKQDIEALIKLIKGT